jgi:hypothetical protein
MSSYHGFQNNEYFAGYQPYQPHIMQVHPSYQYPIHYPMHQPIYSYPIPSSVSHQVMSYPRESYINPIQPVQITSYPAESFTCQQPSQPSQPSQAPQPSRSTFKTKACSLLLSTGKCMKKGCGFAHNKEELKPIKCRDDAICVYSKTTCHFIHTGETKEDYLKRTNIVFPKIENEKYKMCRHQILFGNCRNESCTFAHSFSEIFITKCKNGNGCEFFCEGKCEFIHPCETIESFYIRKIKIHTSLSVKSKSFKEQTDEQADEPSEKQSLKLENIKPILIHFSDSDTDDDDDQ